MLKRIVLLLLLAVPGGLFFCYYDAIPPTDEEFYDTRSTLSIQLSGFAAGRKVRLRYWETPGGSFAYPENYQLFTDGGGNLIVTISAAHGTTNISYFLMVDQNGDNQWDTGDFGIYRANIAISQSTYHATDQVAYAAATLSAYNTVVAAPGAGQKLCIYDPSGEAIWSASLLSNLPEFPEFSGVSLKASDWFTLSSIDSLSVKTPTILPPGNYNETCFTDANLSGDYDLGEAVSASAPVVVP